MKLGLIWARQLQKCRRINQLKLQKYVYLAGLKTGSKDPTQPGSQFITVHEGGKDRFVEGATLIFLAKKGSADFHSDKDGPTYEKWFTILTIDNSKHPTWQRYNLVVKNTTSNNTKI